MSNFALMPASLREGSRCAAGGDKASAEEQSLQEKLDAALETEALLLELLRQEQIVRGTTGHTGN